jgi:hypothetical protein
MSSAATYGALIMTAALFGGVGSGWLADAAKSRITAMVVWWSMAALAPENSCNFATSVSSYKYCRPSPIVK